jgi:hypothetical protein
MSERSPKGVIETHPCLTAQASPPSDSSLSKKGKAFCVITTRLLGQQGVVVEQGHRDVKRFGSVKSLDAFC